MCEISMYTRFYEEKGIRMKRDELKALLEDGPTNIQEPTITRRFPRRHAFDEAFYGSNKDPFYWSDLHDQIPAIEHVARFNQTVEDALAKRKDIT